MNALTITLVRSGRNGRYLIGRTASDRWNMVTLTGGIRLPYTRSQAALKRLRRANPDITLTLSRDATLERMDATERNALIPILPSPPANIKVIPWIEQRVRDTYHNVNMTRDVDGMYHITCAKEPDKYVLTLAMEPTVSDAWLNAYALI